MKPGFFPGICCPVKTFYLFFSPRLEEDEGISWSTSIAKKTRIRKSLWNRCPNGFGESENEQAKMRFSNFLCRFFSFLWNSFSTFFLSPQQKSSAIFVKGSHISHAKISWHDGTRQTVHALQLGKVTTALGHIAEGKKGSWRWRGHYVQTTKHQISLVLL